MLVFLEMDVEKLNLDRSDQIPDPNFMSSMTLGKSPNLSELHCTLVTQAYEWGPCGILEVNGLQKNSKQNVGYRNPFNGYLFVFLPFHLFLPSLFFFLLCFRPIPEPHFLRVMLSSFSMDLADKGFKYCLTQV